MSVVIPTFNGGARVERCLESLSRQPGINDCEVLVVDDGSDAKVSRRALEDAIVGSAVDAVLQWERHAGPNAARNRGVARARGDLVWFLDDDVVVVDGWLEAVRRGLQEYPDTDCFGGRIILDLRGTPPRLCGREGESLGETELDLGVSDKSVELVWGANFGVRRRAFERVGLFLEGPQGSGEETEWQRRLKSAEGKVVYLGHAAVLEVRDPAQLRLRALMFKRWNRSRHAARFTDANDDGASSPMKGSLLAPIRYLAHAVRRRCSWGLLASAQSLGLAFGSMEQRVRRSFSSNGQA